MNFNEKLTAFLEDTGNVILLFKAIWYGTYVLVGLFCLAIVFFMFGLQALAYFTLGIIIVGGLVVIYLLVGQNLLQTILKLIRRSG